MAPVPRLEHCDLKPQQRQLSPPGSTVPTRHGPHEARLPLSCPPQHPVTFSSQDSCHREHEGWGQALRRAHAGVGGDGVLPAQGEEGQDAAVQGQEGEGAAVRAGRLGHQALQAPPQGGPQQAVAVHVVVEHAGDARVQQDVGVPLSALAGVGEPGLVLLSASRAVQGPCRPCHHHAGRHRWRRDALGTMLVGSDGP